MIENKRPLEKLKDDYLNIKSPSNIEEYIQQGIDDAKVSKHSLNKYLYRIAICTLIVFLFILPIRVSPTFASYISKVPGFKYIVSLINGDKSLRKAVDNDFIQHINLFDVKDDVIFTVNDVIIDEERMIIFYSHENTADGEYYNIYSVDITNEEDIHLSAVISYGMDDSRDNDDPSIAYGKIEISFTEYSIIPDTFILKPILIKSENNSFTKTERVDKKSNTNTNQDKGNSNLIDDLEIKFKVDKSKFQNLKKEYIIDKTVKIEDQKITFNKVAISPTRINIDIEFDPSNSKKIFSFDDLKIVDGKGNVYDSNAGDVLASLKDDDHRTIYLESNYFNDVDELYLTFSSIRALDKDKTNVKVDINNKKIISYTDDNLKLKDIIETENSIDLSFEIENNNLIYDEHHYQIFSASFEDAEGNKYFCGCSTRFSTDLSNNIEMNVLYLPKEDYKDFIILKINDYPTRITGETKIKIK